MKLTPEQYIVLEAIFSQATIPLTESEKYIGLLNAMRSSSQNSDSSVSVDMSEDDLKLLHPFILDSDFKLRDLEFVIEFINLIGMSYLTEPLFQKLKRSETNE